MALNIVYTIDKNFLPQAAVSIVSVCEAHDRVDDVAFYVIGMDITHKDIAPLAGIVSDTYGHRVEFVPISDIASMFNDLDTGGWNEVILARLLMARFLPDNLDRVLYLDGDTLVRKNLADLWNTDMEGSPVAACMEPTVNTARKRTLIAEDSPYYNSGVLLVDLARWREEGVEEAILDFCHKNKDKLFASDQDAINAVLEGRIASLSPKYNWCNTYQFYPYKALKKMASPVPLLEEASFEEAITDPAIVHYLGEERPWREGNHHRYRQEWLDNLSKTPYRDMPMEQGWRGYFKAWNLFNGVMSPFPMLRYKIIDALIPRFMEYRKRQRVKDGQQ